MAQCVRSNSQSLPGFAGVFTGGVCATDGAESPMLHPPHSPDGALPEQGPIRLADFQARGAATHGIGEVCCGFLVEVRVTRVPDCGGWGMPTATPMLRTRGTDAPTTPQNPVAGRIAGAPPQAEALIDGWCAYLASIGRSPGTQRVYAGAVRAAFAREGWAGAGDVTFAGVTAHLAAARAEGHWRGTTYNRQLAAFRSFTAWLARAGHLEADPLRDADRAGEHDAGGGARAATTDEARAMIRAAYQRQAGDRRCRADRALYWACLFLSGARGGEPGQWLWSDVLLDEPVPVLRWRAAANKSRHAIELALAPELVQLLRAHRQRMRELAAVEPVARGPYRRADARAVSPDAKGAYVFPWVPTRASFAADRALAGIAETDARGRSYSMHSARKWFATTLTAQGVPAKMVDRLMRHLGTVEARYYEPAAEEMAEALGRLPRLWPVPVGLDGSSGRDVDNFTGLTCAGEHGFISVPTAMSRTQTSSIDPPGPACSAGGWHQREARGPVGSVEPETPDAPAAARGAPGSRSRRSPRGNGQGRT